MRFVSVHASLDEHNDRMTREKPPLHLHAFAEDYRQNHINVDAPKSNPKPALSVDQCMHPHVYEINEKVQKK